MTIDFKPTFKQNILFEYFNNKNITEILYGGAAGGGKSYGVCALIIINCLIYPNIRVGLARNELTTLKKTTLESFMEVINNFGISNRIKYNSQSGTIKFDNNSKVIMQELRYLPSDPQFTRLGGLLLTFGVIDEAGEINKRGKNIFQSRLGRWKNDIFDINPTLVMTCNPTKNFLYDDFYKPFKKNQLKSHQKYIEAYITDNNYLDKSYRENLEKILNNVDKERLLKGNWEYDNDPMAMMDYQSIYNIFISPKQDETYNKNDMKLTADIAFTSDKCVLMVWNKLTVIDIIIDPIDLDNEILILKKKYNIKERNIAYDSDGVGKYLTQKIKRAKPIVNNSKALNGENYKNLKTQLFYKLAEYVNDGLIKIYNTEYRDAIIRELSAMRFKESRDDGKLEMISKSDIKKLIGNSPDFAETIAYRMIFEYNNNITKTFQIV